MRIGMVSTVDEDHLTIGADQSLREIAFIDVHCIDAADVRKLFSLYQGLRENAPRRKRPYGCGKYDAGIASEVLGYRLDTVGFTHKVELLFEELFDLVVIA